VTIELENGETFIPTIPDWYWNADSVDQEGALDLEEEPAAALIELLSPTQLPRLIDPDMVDYVDSQLETLPIDRIDVPPAAGSGTGTVKNSGAGCSAVAGSPAGMGLMLMFLAFAHFRARANRTYR
jgi:hypothetical protein